MCALPQLRDREQMDLCRKYIRKYNNEIRHNVKQYVHTYKVGIMDR